MLATELIPRIEAHLGFDSNPTQHLAIAMLATFVTSRQPRDAFLLNGYAGTGKTSVIGALVRALADEKINTVILAPTGRAAKVAANMAGKDASTIHRRIYHPVGSGLDTKIVFSPNTLKDTIFIVDEASLITHPDSGPSLLAHLVNYVYSGPGCAMILVGDTAQLPPVGQNNSPAMEPSVLEGLGLHVDKAILDVPVRQASESGVLYNATRVREAITDNISLKEKAAKAKDIFSSPLFVNAPKIIPKVNLEPELRIPDIDLRGFDDIRAISSAELADELSSSWSTVGPEETIIITRSNSRANRFNQAIRNMVMYAESPLQQGDRIVVSKNDYFWKERNSQKGFISNGEIALVNWVGRTEKMYGRYFTEVELYFPSDDSTIGATLMLRSLMTEGPSIPKEEMDRFLQHVIAGQEGSPNEKITSALTDPYYNAIQAKYAYCVTCHKSQGGQWKHVYIDMAGIAPENMDISFLRWLYTAMTRATEKVFLINPTVKIID